MWQHLEIVVAFVIPSIIVFQMENKQKKIDFKMQNRFCIPNLNKTPKPKPMPLWCDLKFFFVFFLFLNNKIILIWLDLTWIVIFEKQLLSQLNSIQYNKSTTEQWMNCEQSNSIRLQSVFSVVLCSKASEITFYVYNSVKVFWINRREGREGINVY